MSALARRAAAGAVLAVAPLAASCEPAPSPGAGATAEQEAGSSPADTAPEPAYVRYAQIGPGGDTLRLERVLRAPGRLGTLVELRGGRPEISLDGVLDGEGRFRSLTVERTAGEGAGRRTLHFGDASVLVERSVGDSVEASEIEAVGGAMPFAASSAALLEQILQRSRRSDPPVSELTILDLASDGRSVERLTLEWVRPDSAVVRIGGSTVEVLLDDDGRIVRTLRPGSGTRRERLR